MGDEQDKFFNCYVEKDHSASTPYAIYRASYNCENTSWSADYYAESTLKNQYVSNKIEWGPSFGQHRITAQIPRFSDEEMQAAEKLSDLPM